VETTEQDQAAADAKAEADAKVRSDAEVDEYNISKSSYLG